jgi:2-methylcitrate dehydratase PrpD
MPDRPAVYPNHYDVGWRLTGTAGVFGSAAAVGKLLNLNEQQMVWALGLAASQPVGLRESFGSMNKSFNPGRAASNGVFAALLGRHSGFVDSACYGCLWNVESLTSAAEIARMSVSS